MKSKTLCCTFIYASFVFFDSAKQVLSTPLAISRTGQRRQPEHAAGTINQVERALRVCVTPDWALVGAP
jgi:hypothetical protein